MTDVLERAVKRHYGAVYRYVWRRTGDRERAEDLTQEVFAAAAAALPTERDGDPPVLAWLYTVAQRRFADEARRRARQPAPAPASSASIEYGPPLTRSITSALRRLPTAQQRVLALKLLHGLRFAEIATELGIETPAAKMRFVRALEALREELRKEGVEP